jgi:hypothetical protein
MRTTMLARQRDQAGKWTLCIVRHAERSHVAVIPRPGQLLPLDDGAYDVYEVKPRRAPAFGPARHWRFAGGALTWGV